MNNMEEGTLSAANASHCSKESVSIQSEQCPVEFFAKRLQTIVVTAIQNCECTFLDTFLQN